MVGWHIKAPIIFRNQSRGSIPCSGRSAAPNFTWIGATSRPCGVKMLIYGLWVKKHYRQFAACDNPAFNKLCAWRHNMPPPLQVDNIFTFIRQVAVLFRHDNIFVFIRQVAPVPACWLFKTSATSWPLTFWPWKWCPSHVTWATSVPILVFLGLSVLELGPMYVTDRRQTSDRRQTTASLKASALWGRRHKVKSCRPLVAQLAKLLQTVLIRAESTGPLLLDDRYLTRSALLMLTVSVRQPAGQNHSERHRLHLVRFTSYVQTRTNVKQCPWTRLRMPWPDVKHELRCSLELTRNHFIYFRQGGYVYISVCLFVCLAELGQNNRLNRFSQNSVEKWHKGQGRND